MRAQPMVRYQSGGALWLCLVVLALSSFALPPEDAYVLPPRDDGGLSLPPPPEPMPYVMAPGYAELVHYWADKRGLPHWLVARAFGQENQGDPLSGNWNGRTSWMGARGPAQIMPANMDLTTKRGQQFTAAYHRGMQIDPADPADAVEVLTGYLADLVRWTGSFRLGLMAYNGGAGHWLDPRRYGPWTDESIGYVKAIIGGAQ